MKLYTKKGDDGSTQLFGGKEVSKDHLRVMAYGEVDELNAILGVARATCSLEQLQPILQLLQPRLFDIGTDLCTPNDSPARKHINPVAEKHIAELESHIDTLCDQLPALTQFILPGGTPLAAYLHHARTVTRRAERTMVALHHTEPLNPNLIIWINRLSDLLFAMARAANHFNDHPETTWSAE